MWHLTGSICIKYQWPLRWTKMNKDKDRKTQRHKDTKTERQKDWKKQKTERRKDRKTYSQKKERQKGERGHGGGKSSQFLSIVLDDLWSKRSVDLSWLLDQRCYIYLRWSCFNIFLLFRFVYFKILKRFQEFGANSTFQKFKYCLWQLGKWVTGARVRCFDGNRRNRVYLQTQKI